jgi:hypothetical protein
MPRELKNKKDKFRENRLEIMQWITLNSPNQLISKSKLIIPLHLNKLHSNTMKDKQFHFVLCMEHRLNRSSCICWTLKTTNFCLLNTQTISGQLDPLSTNLNLSEMYFNGTISIAENNSLFYFTF